MSIEKVAQLAGVSTSTVSRVINKHPRVAPDTARAVREAMEKLAYSPSERRPGPKPASVQPQPLSIGLVLVGDPDPMATPGFLDLIRGVATALGEHHHKLCFTCAPDPTRTPACISEQLPDGIIMLGIPPQQAFAELLQDIPTVWVMGRHRHAEPTDRVMPDLHEVGEIALKYLAEHNCQNTAFVNLDRQHWTLNTYGHCFISEASRKGIHAVTIERDAAPQATTKPGYDPKTVHSVVQELLKLDPAPTGIFVADALQTAVIEAELWRQGVDLTSQKLRIITCNHHEICLTGLLTQPAVIDIPSDRLGRQAVEQLLWRMSTPRSDDGMTAMIRPTLVR